MTGYDCDPWDVYVEATTHQSALDFANNDPLLCTLGEDTRQECADHIARMMTALKNELFLCEDGAAIKSLDLIIDGIEAEQTMVIVGTKYIDSDVGYEGCVLDKATAHQVLGYS